MACHLLTVSISLLLVLSNGVSGQLEVDNTRNTQRYQYEIEGILNGTFTKSPLGYLFPLEPSQYYAALLNKERPPTLHMWKWSVSTSLVIIGILGVIGVLTTLVYWPLPRKYQHDAEPLVINAGSPS